MYAFRLGYTAEGINKYNVLSKHVLAATKGASLLNYESRL